MRKERKTKLAEKSQANEVIVLTPVAHLVKHVHIKDVIGKEAVALGKGEVNLIECLRILKRNGFEGVLSLETKGNQTGEETKSIVTEQAERSNLRVESERVFILKPNSNPRSLNTTFLNWHDKAREMS